MRMVTLSIPVALALCVGAAQLSAQQPGNGTFQWYVGGQGGIMNFNSLEGRQTKPLGGAHLLITARRTGLLLSVEQAFGSNVASAYNLTAFDSVGNVTSSQDIFQTFDYLRKYSATLMAFPIKGPMTPFVGIGVGILHAGGFTPPDDGDAETFASSGFGSLIGGLNFRVSRFSAFGQYQITTGPGFQAISRPGPNKSTLVSSGRIISGATHTFSAGLRFGLGNAKERASGGGY